jgi:hypothetical protein
MGAEHIRRPDVAPGDPATGGIAQRSSPTAWRFGYIEPARSVERSSSAYLRARAVTETYKARTAQLEYLESLAKA